MSAANKILMPKHAEVAPAPALIPRDNPLLAMLGNLATNANFNPEAFKAIVDLVREEKAGAAKAEFNAAFAAMQAELPPAPKNGKGHNNKAYARYEDIDRVAKPVLGKHGLSINHTIHQDDNKVKIRAVLRHLGGHEESAEIILPLDTSGSKNPVQAYGSTTAYGKRYTYAALIGISAEETDDDAQTSSGATVTDDQAKALAEAIEFSGASEERFKKHFKISELGKLPQAKFSDAMEMLKRRAGA